MLVGQKLGPFLIEKELGAGAMGAVYRGKYEKTGQIVAVKVMAPGLGTSSDSAGKRFEREANILKQLHHPNIVRLFGTGKYKGTPYYAMEYIQGESLDRIMARRDRMTWDELIVLGRQLCAALQHAHQAGIVHRDLKPSNLMILPDGTLKLTDFGIAKDLDVTQLTGANCTVGTASYMSPEQCRGETNLSHKSDLYSLGVVFYELITGRKPFIAENAMDMFMLHVNGTFERPSRLVLDIPIWLDTLICQLLEKKPEQRPLDADMVANVLESIKEKVEAQQSAGAEKARSRLLDLPRDQRNLSDEDRDATVTLLGKKPRKKSKKKARRRLTTMLQAAGLVALLGLIAGTIYFATRPPSADSLHRQAKRLMDSGNEDKITEAREGPIERYLSLYSTEDEKGKQMRKWADDYDVARYEKLLDRHVRHVKENKGLAVVAQNASDKLAFDAAIAEYEGDGERAEKFWKGVLEKNEAKEAMLVARRHLAALQAIEGTLKYFDAKRQEIRPALQEPNLNELQRQAFLARRAELLGDVLGAQRRYEMLREQASKDTGSREWQLFAGVRSKQLKDALQLAPQTDDEVTKILDERLKLHPAEAELDQRLRAQDIVVLYEKDAKRAVVVEKARQLIAEIEKRTRGL